MTAGEIAIAALAKLDALTMDSKNWKKPNFKRRVRLTINTAYNEMKAAKMVRIYCPAVKGECTEPCVGSVCLKIETANQNRG